jgi:hypothetical protein
LFQSNIIAGVSCSAYPVSTICTMPNPIPLGYDNKVIGADKTKVVQ